MSENKLPSTTEISRAELSAYYQLLKALMDKVRHDLPSNESYVEHLKAGKVDYDFHLERLRDYSSNSNSSVVRDIEAKLIRIVIKDECDFFIQSEVKGIEDWKHAEDILKGLELTIAGQDIQSKLE